jgi:hypothetical protein
VHATHGVVGGNLFLGAYVLAMLSPSLRLFSAWPQNVKWFALVVMVVTAIGTVVSIRVHGGGGAGELLGCIAGALAWLGRFVGPALSSRPPPASSQPDLWQIVGGSIPPVLMALTLWFVRRARRE